MKDEDPWNRHLTGRVAVKPLVNSSVRISQKRMLQSDLRNHGSRGCDGIHGQGPLILRMHAPMDARIKRTLQMRGRIYRV